MSVIEQTIDAERQFRSCLETIGAALDSAGAPINPTQALILCRMNPEIQPTMKQIQCGCYDGSNAHYNVMILRSRGYLERRKDPSDHRCVRICLTDSGKELREELLFLLGEDECEMSAVA